MDTRKFHKVYKIFHKKIDINFRTRAHTKVIKLLIHFRIKMSLNHPPKNPKKSLKKSFKLSRQKELNHQH
jgi:hypothetical protein